MIGMAQDGLATFEPAFADELNVIMRWGFDYMQRDGAQSESEENWLRDEKGGSLYLRLSTAPQDQLQRDLSDTFAKEVVAGGYWLRPPTASTSIVLAYTGVVASQTIQAAGLLVEDIRDVAVLAITSADRLNAGWQAAERARQRGDADAVAHIEVLLADAPRDAGLVTVTDGHPAGLSWLGGVNGHRTKSLGVEHFGQAGTIEDIYHLHGLDTNAIMHAARALLPGRGALYLTPLAG
jgi:pyruvate dehydrogenase E1 component